MMHSTWGSKPGRAKNPLPLHHARVLTRAQHHIILYDELAVSLEVQTMLLQVGYKVQHVSLACMAQLCRCSATAYSYFSYAW
jgi:hypothetical protein